MKWLSLPLLSLLFVAGCGSGQKPDTSQTLAEARRGFQTKLVRKESAHEAVPVPPANLFQSVRYDSPAGQLAAYVSKPPHDGKKHPAIIWIFGGFDNGIGDTAWAHAAANNDQSASAFRKAGLIMMYPSLRGGNDNPGYREALFGEVDDVLAAADYLAKQDFVDPKRIYLGGHSTGGTLVLLAAECGDKFRAVFSFGPVDDVAGYGTKDLPFDTSNKRELELRAPALWLHSIKCPTFVFEGTGNPGNAGALQTLKKASSNPLLHFYAVKGATHFSILAPVTEAIANKVVGDSGEHSNLDFTESELNARFGG